MEHLKRSRNSTVSGEAALSALNVIMRHNKIDRLEDVAARSVIRRIGKCCSQRIFFEGIGRDVGRIRTFLFYHRGVLSEYGPLNDISERLDMELMKKNFPHYKFLTSENNSPLPSTSTSPGILNNINSSTEANNPSPTCSKFQLSTNTSTPAATSPAATSPAEDHPSGISNIYNTSGVSITSPISGSPGTSNNSSGSTVYSASETNITPGVDSPPINLVRADNSSENTNSKLNKFIVIWNIS